MRPAVGPCILVLLLALGLRLVEAERKSFWVDELHTVHIANGDGVRGVVARVLPDFHAPLYFLGAHAVRDLPPHARRGLSIVASLATVLLLLALARASGFGGRSRLVMGLVLATVPFRIQYGTELRPYAWLEFSTAGLLWAAFTPAPRPWRRMAAVAGFATFGLYSHYLAAVAILGVGAARLFFRSPLWLRLDRLVLAGSVGVALFVPWVRYDESWILEDPGVMVRNESGTPGAPDGVGLMARVEKAWPELRRNLVDLAPRTLLPAGSGLGPRAGKVALVGVGVFGVALAAALALGGRRRGPSERRASAVGVGGAIVACVFAGLLVALLSVFVWQRIALQYFALLAPVWPLVAGLLVERLGSSRLAAAVALAMVLGSATAGVAHVLGDAREDLRGGVAAALRAGADRDAVYSALLWQPEYYSNTEVYEVYAPSLSTVEPASIPAAKAPGESPIILLTRNMPVEQAHRHPHVWKELRVHRRVASTIVVDPSTIVYVLAPDPDAFR